MAGAGVAAFGVVVAVVALSAMLADRLESLLGWSASIVGTKNHPPGHLMPLGSHRPPNAQESVPVYDHVPYPKAFFRDHILPGRPAVFRGLAARMPAYRRWTDEYFKEKFGNLTMSVETNKKENRKGDVQDMTFGQFLEVYKTKDLYLVGSAPYQMLSDFHLPRFLLCSSFIRVLNDVILWISSGGTKSVLHYDELDNINCVLDGEKQFFLIDKAEESHVSISDAQGAYSEVDVDRVDMYAYPGLRHVPWYNVTVSSGDCLFIPYRWFHHVRSSAGRNVAINTWFVHVYWFDDSSKEEQNLPETAPFDNLDFCAAEECLRAELVGFTNGTDPLNLRTFTNLYERFIDASVGTVQVFQKLDLDNDGFLTLQEFYTSDAKDALHLFAKFGGRTQ